MSLDSRNIPKLKTALPKPLFENDRINSKKTSQGNTATKLEEQNESDDLCGISQKLLAYVIIVVAFMLVIISLQSVLLNNFVDYTNATEFPEAGTFIIFSFTALIFLAYGCYLGSYDKSVETWIFWLFLLANVLFFFWTFNLQLRAERFARGLEEINAGSFYLVIAIIVVCILLILCASQGIFVMIAVFICLAWFLYLLYKWWFDATNCDGKGVKYRY